MTMFIDFFPHPYQFLRVLLQISVNFTFGAAPAFPIGAGTTATPNPSTNPFGATAFGGFSGIAAATGTTGT